MRPPPMRGGPVRRFGASRSGIRAWPGGVAERWRHGPDRDSRSLDLSGPQGSLESGHTPSRQVRPPCPPGRVGPCRGARERRSHRRSSRLRPRRARCTRCAPPAPERSPAPGGGGRTTIEGVQRMTWDTNIFIAEVFGTGLLILLGDGVVAGVLLAKSKAQNAGWIVITAARAFAVFVGVVVAGPISGAHLNPAVTIGLAVQNSI